VVSLVDLLNHRLGAVIPAGWGENAERELSATVGVLGGGAFLRGGGGGHRQDARATLGGLDGAGAFAFFDEFPEVFAFGEDFVFWAGDFAAVAEEEVGEGIFVEDAVDADAGVDDFEVDAVAFGAEAVEFFAAAGDEAEAFAVWFLEVVWGDFEFGEEVELEQRVELAHFCGADFVEDDLEHDGEWWEC